ncbi:MAG TPA: zinc ribbon domain-containing protein [Trebonia sp.]
MPLYEYACGRGHRFERLVPFANADSPSLACPSCGTTECRRLPSSAALLGRAAPPPGRDAAPRSWEETHGGDRDTILHWQRSLEQRRTLEEKYPELSGDTRPVLAHEGPYAAAPLRADSSAGDSLRAAQPAHPHPHPHHSPEASPPPSIPDKAKSN